jgi:AraC-like DNA-binding protein
VTPPRPSQAFIPPRYYATLLDVLAERDHDRDALLAHAHIAPAVFGSEAAYLTLDQVEALVGRACVLENTDELGLQVGQRLQLMSHGTLSVAALTSRTVADAVELVVECFALVMPLFTLGLHSLGEATAIRLSVRWPLDAEVERFHTATMSGSLYAQLRFLLGGAIPTGVELDARHPRPPGLPDWVNGTGVAIRFDRPCYELRIPTSTLGVRLPLADSRAHETARQRCRSLLKARPDPVRFSAAVERVLRANGPPFPGLEATSRMLSVSSRSLRRKLKDESASFRTILESARLAIAEEWLGDPRRSITEIGIELGYADPANFTRAFRRARGQSPTEVRAAKLATLAADARLPSS